MPPRIGHLLSSSSRAGGGIPQAVANLTQALGSSCIAETHIFAMEDDYTETDQSQWRHTTLKTRKVIGPKQFGFAPGLLRDLLDADLDILHVHGIWMYPSLLGPHWARRTGRPLVLTTHGMLDPWLLSRGRAKKAAAITLYERRNWHNVSLFHALTITESQQISALMPTGKCMIIPNMLPLDAYCDTSCRASLCDKFMLYLGRLHEKKNLIRLIEAWAHAKLSLRGVGYRLKIVGWGEEIYIRHLQDTIFSYDLEDDIEILRPAFGARKNALLSAADFLLLPSLGEGLPMAITEAWARGTPTAMSQFCNISEGFESGAAVNIGTSVEEISRCLERLARMDRISWTLMSQAASKLAQTRFHPTAVISSWREAYGSLLKAR